MTEKKKAVLVKEELKGFTGNAALYRMVPPLEGSEYVAVSATYVPLSGPETYIFPADKDGNVTSWGELPGSYRGGYDHDVALEEAGYEVVQEA